MKKSTRAEVALKAGVSTATVSNVLNNRHKVKDETVARVNAAIKALDYRPNMVARSLSTRKTMQIGIVLEDIRNPYYGEIVEHFEALASQKGYFVNICVGMNKVDHYFDNFIARGLDGAFVAALPYKFNTDKLYSLLDNDIKLVVSGNTNIDFRLISSIENDYMTAMQQAMDYLMSLGHENIAYLSGLGKSLTYDDRCRAYLEYNKRKSLPGNGSLLMDGQYPYYTNVHSGYSQAMRLLESERHFTAVICGNDLMALGAMRAFSEKGLKVPKDISVMGFDGISSAKYFMPSLTTMAVEAKTFGGHAFELLYANMKNEPPGFYRNVLTFREGESTGRRA